MIKRTDTTIVFKGFLSGTFNGYSFINLPVANTSGNDKAGFDLMKKMANSFGMPVSYLKLKQ